MAFFTADDLEPTYADLGRAERWSASACKSAADVFEGQGWDATFLKFPEAYPNARFLPEQEGLAPGEADQPVHVSYRPVERMNLVKGAYNVYACPWRYPTITEHFAHGSLIQQNMKHMLSLPDEVWASSEYAAEAFRKAGVENVRAMPAAVPAIAPARDVLRTVEGWTMRFDGFTGEPAEKGRLEELLRAQSRTKGKKATPPKLFVSVVDPFDPCANFEQMLRGFMVATANDPDAMLVTVLAISAEDRAGLKAADIGYRLAERCFKADADLISDRIVLVSDRMPQARMAGLLALADFYLCASSAEEQNLPLQMAMAGGAAPVSTRVTAMAEYLDDANSIGIATEAGAIETAGLAAAAVAPVIGAEVPTARMVATAVRQALALTDEGRGRLSAAAKRVIDERYSQRAVAERIEARLVEIAAERSAAEVDENGPSDATPFAASFEALAGDQSGAMDVS